MRRALRHILFGAGYSFANAEAESYVSRLPPQTDARKALIDAFFGSIKTAGVLAKADAMYLIGATEATWLQNLKSSSFTLTPVNAPTYTADRGPTFNGSTQSYDTGLNLSLGGFNYTLNNAGMGVWNRIAKAAANAYEIGTAQFRVGVYHNNASQPRYFANDGSARNSGAVADAVGWTSARRTAAAISRALRNGVALGVDATTASTSISNETVKIGGNIGATYSAAQVCAGYVGAALSDAEDMALYNALNTYLTAIGAA